MVYPDQYDWSLEWCEVGCGEVAEVVVYLPDRGAVVFDDGVGSARGEGEVGEVDVTGETEAIGFGLEVGNGGVAGGVEAEDIVASVAF